MRSCPYCAGSMESVPYFDIGIQREVDQILCIERCQHRRCQVCEKDIHRGSKDDPAYYDNTGNAGCYVNHIQIPFGEIEEEIVGHQP